MTDTTTPIRRKPATLRLVEAGRIVGVGRQVAYEAGRRGQLIEGVPVLKVGQQLRVPVAALERALGIDILDYLDDDEAAS